MMRLCFTLALLFPSFATAADYVQTERTVVIKSHRVNCPLDNAGNRYCVQRPVERFITDCDVGLNCTHMQSGQHYSVQRPVGLE